MAENRKTITFDNLSVNVRFWQYQSFTGEQYFGLVGVRG
jgi:hypothetical protein